MNMIKGPQTPPDDLDRLLSRVKRPEPPAWFEARLMARIRREENQKAQWWGNWARTWSILGIVTAVLLITGISLQMTGVFQSGQPTVAQVSPPANLEALTNTFHFAKLEFEESPISVDQKITEGLNAFLNYSEEEELWSTAATSL